MSTTTEPHTMAHADPTKCEICEDDMPEPFKLTPPSTTDCQHPNEVCPPCWQQWLNQQLQTTAPSRISCAQCDTILGEAEVKAYASKELHERYLELAFKESLSNMRNFNYCLAPTCSSGQIQDNGEVYFNCKECEFEQCTACGVAWHHDRSCEEVQMEKELEGLGLDSDEASEKIVNWRAKECPGCQSRIEKDGGCDHMSCTKCNYEFCWLCLGDWRNGIHHEGCPDYHPQDEDEEGEYEEQEAEVGEHGLPEGGVETGAQAVEQETNDFAALGCFAAGGWDDPHQGW